MSLSQREIQDLYGESMKPMNSYYKVKRTIERCHSGEPLPRQIQGNRSAGDYEIPLHDGEVAAKWDCEKSLPILDDGNTTKQVGIGFREGSNAIVRFSRSESGQRACDAFLKGNSELTLSYLTERHGRKPVALSIRAVSDGTEKETVMSEQITIPKETIRQIVRQELKADQPLSTPEIIEHQERSFSLTKAINAEIHGDWTDAGFEREQCQEAKRNYVGQARGMVIPSDALWSRTTMATTGDIAGAIGTDLREDLYIDALRPMSSVVAAGARILNLSAKTSLPKNNNDVSAAWTTEGGAITESDIDIDVITLEPKMLAGRASYTRQVLATATPNIETLVRRNLQLQIANALDDAALDGSGSSGQPTGIANTTGIETFATAGSSTMTHAESLDAMAEVAANFFDTSNGTWLINPTDAATLGAQTVDSGSGRFVYQDGRITGRRAIETTHVAAETAYFGLFDNVMIGMFGGIDIVTDPYTNGSTGVVNIYAYQMADVAVAHAGAFQKVTLTA